jgi:hypothetical protein
MMDLGDLVLTSSRQWHDHGNAGAIAEERYRMRAIGDEISKTIGASAYRINAGTSSAPPRETARAVMHVYQGAGQTSWRYRAFVDVREFNLATRMAKTRASKHGRWKRIPIPLRRSPAYGQSRSLTFRPASPRSASASDAGSKILENRNVG